jgi:hypothetical protein
MSAVASPIPLLAPVITTTLALIPDMRFSSPVWRLGDLFPKNTPAGCRPFRK